MCDDPEENCLDILSIDGGGVRGLIPTVVVDYMEDYAYNYSLSKGYIKAEDHPNQKVSMSKLYNIIASSSTGSILGGALVTPK